MSKPGMLQFNAAGAWRNVCAVDLDDQIDLQGAMVAAALLSFFSADRPGIRIMDKSSLSTAPVFIWSDVAGWTHRSKTP